MIPEAAAYLHGLMLPLLEIGDLTELHVYHDQSEGRPGHLKVKLVVGDRKTGKAYGLMRDCDTLRAGYDPIGIGKWDGARIARQLRAPDASE